MTPCTLPYQGGGSYATLSPHQRHCHTDPVDPAATAEHSSLKHQPRRRSIFNNNNGNNSGHGAATSSRTKTATTTMTTTPQTHHVPYTPHPSPTYLPRHPSGGGGGLSSKSSPSSFRLTPSRRTSTATTNAATIADEILHDAALLLGDDDDYYLDVDQDGCYYGNNNNNNNHRSDCSYDMNIIDNNINNKQYVPSFPEMRAVPYQQQQQLPQQVHSRNYSRQEPLPPREFVLPPSSVSVQIQNNSHSNCNNINGNMSSMSSGSLHSPGRRRASTTTTSPILPTTVHQSRRCSNQSRLDDFQREVDVALQMFSNDINFDDDDDDNYDNFDLIAQDEKRMNELNLGSGVGGMSSMMEKLSLKSSIHTATSLTTQDVTTVATNATTTSSREDGSEDYDSFPGTACTSLATSSDCGDVHVEEGDVGEGEEVEMMNGLEAPDTPRMSGSNPMGMTNNSAGGTTTTSFRRSSIAANLSQLAASSSFGSLVGFGAAATPSTPGGNNNVGGFEHGNDQNGGEGGLSLKHKTKSILSLPLSLLPSKTTMNNCIIIQEEDDSIRFETVVMEELKKLGIKEEDKKDRSFYVDFEACSSLRGALEPFLSVARLQREEGRQQVFNILQQMISPEMNTSTMQTHIMRRSSIESTDFSTIHIGSNYGVPYPALRTETPFLYDTDSYPLDKILAQTLGVEDLSKIHLQYPCSIHEDGGGDDKARLMSPLQNRSKRRAFHRIFDSFVTSHVIPLLHSKALASDIFYTNRHQLRKGKPQKIVYRYQAFPCIRIVRPGECSVGPHCDMMEGHSIGNISFHIPLTASFGTNALYVESRPGREDWHPLLSKSGPGLGFQFDGSRCLHFTLNNDTDVTRVSLDFRIAITRASSVKEVMASAHPPAFVGEDHMVEYDPDDQLCCPQLLHDEYSSAGPGYYDEVVVSVGEVPRSFLPGPVAMKRPFSENKLYDPDERVGFPFSIASNCCNQR